MAIRLTDSQTTTSAGIKNPATLTKWPEGGANVTVGVTTGTAVVELWAWISSSYKEKLASFTLPVPAGQDKAGDLYDSLPVESIWTDWEWNVVSLSGGGTLSLVLVGLGA